MKKLCGILVLLLVIVLLFIDTRPIYANLPAPPSYVWFVFSSSDWKKIQGIQIIGFSSSESNDSILLHNYGKCTSKECMHTDAVFDQEGDNLICANYRCLSRVYPTHGGLNFKVLIQSQDRILESGNNYTLANQSGGTQYWVINLQEDGVVLHLDPDLAEKKPEKTTAFSSLGLFAFSIFVELIVAFFYFWFLFKDTKKIIGKLIFIVLFANLLTLPVVWRFFPAFSYFHSSGYQNLGFLILSISIFYGVLLFFIYHKKTKHRKVLIILTSISIPISLIILVFFSFGFLYGEKPIIAQGLPGFVLISLEEIFAFITEGVLLHFYSDKIVTWKNAWLLSFLMNSASFIMGMLFR